MNAPAANKIYSILLELCKIPSVSGDAQEENRCAKTIFDFLEGLENKSAGNLKAYLVPCENDPLNRNAVFALLRSKRKTAKTIILTGHFDVVDTECCGNSASLAFDPEVYTTVLKEKDSRSDVKEDLQSGNWLFGRGTMDMKAGLALFLAAIEEWASDPDLPINILFWVVPDEESNSAGMIGTLRFFNELRKKESLKVIAAFTGEPCFWTPQTEKKKAVRPYFLGSTGKLMPFVYALGKSVHVGNYFEGVNAALMISEVVCLAEGNPQFFEGERLDLLSPPVCLKMETRRRNYSVTVPGEAVAYFNYLTALGNVRTILNDFVKVAEKAAEKVKVHLRHAGSEADKRGGSVPEPSEIEVMTYKELKDKACSVKSQTFVTDFDDFWRKSPRDLDMREAAIRECEWLIERAQLHEPCYIVGFLPPFYPARINNNETENDRKLRKVVSEIVEQAKELSNDGSVEMHEVFGGISDLSFLGFSTLKQQGIVAGSNMAGWDKVFNLPTDLDFDEEIPVANMGPAGKDAHRHTERLELTYSLEVAPRLLTQAIIKISEET